MKKNVSIKKKLAICYFFRANVNQYLLKCLPSLKIQILFQPEQEKAPARMFLKIGACPNAYKKKVDDARVRTTLEDLLILKFETFENAEFIFSLFYN